jgi:hypothetical protein
MFLPFPGYESCLPVVELCRGPGFGFLVVPPQMVDLAWTFGDIESRGIERSLTAPTLTGPAALPLNLADLEGLGVLNAVAALGGTPAFRADTPFFLPVVASPAIGGDLTMVPTQLSFPVDAPPVLVRRDISGLPDQVLLPVPAGLTGIPPMDDLSATVTYPFGPMEEAEADEFEEIQPFLPVMVVLDPDVGGQVRTVMFGAIVVGDDGDPQILPFFGSADEEGTVLPSLPFLARKPEGAVGVFVPDPRRAPADDPGSTVAGRTDSGSPLGGDDDGLPWGLFLALAGAVIAVAGGSAALASRRSVPAGSIDHELPPVGADLSVTSSTGGPAGDVGSLIAGSHGVACSHLLGRRRNAIEMARSLKEKAEASAKDAERLRREAKEARTRADRARRRVIAKGKELERFTDRSLADAEAFLDRAVDSLDAAETDMRRVQGEYRSAGGVRRWFRLWTAGRRRDARADAASEANEKYQDVVQARDKLHEERKAAGSQAVLDEKAAVLGERRAYDSERTAEAGRTAAEEAAQGVGDSTADLKTCVMEELRKAQANAASAAAEADTAATAGEAAGQIFSARTAAARARNGAERATAARNDISALGPAASAVGLDRDLRTAMKVVEGDVQRADRAVARSAEAVTAAEQAVRDSAEAAARERRASEEESRRADVAALAARAKWTWVVENMKELNVLRRVDGSKEDAQAIYERLPQWMVSGGGSGEGSSGLAAAGSPDTIAEMYAVLTVALDPRTEDGARTTRERLLRRVNSRSGKHYTSAEAKEKIELISDVLDRLDQFRGSGDGSDGEGGN